MFPPSRSHAPTAPTTRHRQTLCLVRVALAAFGVVLATACQDAAPPDPRLGTLTSVPDSLATLAEIRASIAGERAPGAEAYSFRGVYAGMPQTRLNAKLLGTGNAADSGSCMASPKIPAELLCTRNARLGDDQAPVRLDVVYAAASTAGVRVTREVTVTRDLPLDVDGVRVAAALADAFEQQTRLLDSRDATYGHHSAHIRMGTLNGARAHFAEVTVTAHSGREELTVKMGRGPGG